VGLSRRSRGAALILLRHQFGGAGVSDTQLRSKFPYTATNGSLGENVLTRMCKEIIKVGGVSKHSYWLSACQ
jgi:hypothetical protein